MTHQDKTRFPAGSKIIFIMPPFYIFITSNLSYYADVLGMPITAAVIGALGACSPMLTGINHLKHLMLRKEHLSL
jgi:hypothetical protein